MCYERLTYCAIYKRKYRPDYSHLSLFFIYTINTKWCFNNFIMLQINIEIFLYCFSHFLY